MNQTTFDLEEFILKNHNPNNQYYLVKHNIKNLENDVFEFDEFIDKDNFKLYQKIDIFRGTMQYIEEYLLYFFAKFYGEKYSKVLARTDNRHIFQKINDIQELDDLPNKLIKTLKLNESNVTEFISGLNNITNFFITYKDIYNSIKHGFRAFPYKFDYFKIGNDKIPYEKLDISEDYIEFICKSGEIIYSLGFPIECLVEDSEIVLEYVHELFNFTMRKNKYENNSNFQCPNTKGYNKYIHLRNGEATLIFKYDEWFETYLSGNELIFYGNFEKNNYKLKIKLSPIPEYPLIICVVTLNSLSTSPKLFEVNKLKIIKFNEQGDIDQIKILNELKNSIDDDMKFVVEFNNEKYECNNLDLGEYNDYEFEEHIINIGTKLKKILHINVSYPFKLAEKQYELLTKHDGNFEKKIDAENFVKEIKKYNRTSVNVFLAIKNTKEGIVSKKFLGNTFNLNILKFFNLEKLEDEEKIYSYAFKEIPTNASFVLSSIQEHLYGGNELFNLEKYNFIDELYIKIGYDKKLWANEYNILITAYTK